MKLYAGRTIDHQDLTRLRTHIKFTSSNDVIERFHDAYQFAAEDPYLFEYIDAIRHREEAP